MEKEEIKSHGKRIEAGLFWFSATKAK